jgi:hypothetical protein
MIPIIRFLFLLLQRCQICCVHFKQVDTELFNHLCRLHQVLHRIVLTPFVTGQDNRIVLIPLVTGQDHRGRLHAVYDGLPFLRELCISQPQHSRNIGAVAVEHNRTPTVWHAKVRHAT